MSTVIRFVKDAAAAPTRPMDEASRRKALARRRREKAAAVAAAVGLVLFVGSLMAALGPSARPGAEALSPRDVSDLVAASATVRAGTILQVSLEERPAASERAAFVEGVEALALRAAEHGYRGLRVTAPDGTTLASGSVDDVRFAPEDAGGT